METNGVGERENMSRRLVVINIVIVITELILYALYIIGFVWATSHFQQWWLMLFTILPVALYSNHSLIVDADIRDIMVDAFSARGGEEDTKE